MLTLGGYRCVHVQKSSATILYLFLTTSIFLKVIESGVPSEDSVDVVCIRIVQVNISNMNSCIIRVQ